MKKKTKRYLAVFIAGSFVLLFSIFPIFPQVEMGIAYVNACYHEYGTVFAPNEFEHQRITEEMTINGLSVADYQRSKGLVVGNGLSNRFLRKTWWSD